jgi:hypothetical protein
MTTQLYATGPIEGIPTKHQQLRALNNEHRDTQEALNHAQVSITRAQKLNEQNYHRKRRAILSNGHDDDE